MPAITLKLDDDFYNMLIDMANSSNTTIDDLIVKSVINYKKEKLEKEKLKLQVQKASMKVREESLKITKDFDE